MERYKRNIQIPQIGESGQKKLLDAKVLIAGAGGLGSSVIANLAGAGIGTLGIIDYDAVELSNLNRQYLHKFSSIGTEKVKSAQEWVREYNPNIEVKIYPLKLNENNYKEIVKEYDLIIDCFDSFESKFLLNEIALKAGKTLIHGGVSEFCGQVCVIVPRETACLYCLFDKPEKKYDLPMGVISPAVSTIASIQAMETIKLLLKIGNPLKNRLLCFDGLKMTFKELKISKNRHCKFCGK